MVVGDRTKASDGSVEVVIGVVGTGIGVEIAQLAAQVGFKVVLKSRSRESLDKAFVKLSNKLLKILSVEEKDKILSRIDGVTAFKPLGECDVIIEAIIEDFGEKQRLFAELDRICPDETVFATNTSSLSVSALASATNRADRVVGMHFFNPPTKMRLVEVVRGDKTSAKTLEFIDRIARKMDKTTVVVNDTPCFIVNRMLMPQLNEAVLMLEEKIAKPEDIDSGAKNGLNHPMGPLALLDLIGVDVFVEIMNNLYHRTGNQKYKPAELAVKMVKEGKLGRKTKEGFFRY